MAAAAFASHLDDPGLLEHVEVARCRRPAVLESRREIARRQLAAAMAEEQHDLPARFVRERGEYSVDIGQGGRLAHVRALLARWLIISKQAN